MQKAKGLRASFCATADCKRLSSRGGKPGGRTAVARHTSGGGLPKPELGTRAWASLAGMTMAEDMEVMSASGRRGILLSKFPDAAIHCEQRAPCQGRARGDRCKARAASLRSCPADPFGSGVRSRPAGTTGLHKPEFAAQVTSKRRKSGARSAHSAHFFCAFAVVDLQAWADSNRLTNLRQSGAAYIWPPAAA